MSDLGPGERDLFDALREEQGPTAEDRARVRAGVAARLGMVAATTAATTTVAKTANASGGVSAAAWMKVGAVAALLGVGAASLVFQSPAPPSPTPSLPPHAATESHDQARIETPSAVGTEKESADLGIAEKKAVAPSKESKLDREQNAAPFKRTSAPVVAPSRVDMEGELKLLARAQKALKSGNVTSALKALGEHAAAYPNGVLAVERSGVRAVALCQAGRAQGPSAAKRFLSKNPKSPLAARVRAACFSSDE